MNFNFLKNWFFKNDFPVILQNSRIEGGSICLQMIGKYYGWDLNLEELKKVSKTDFTGTSLQGLSDAANHFGFKSLCIKITLRDLLTIPLPAIAHWKGDEFIVVYKMTKSEIFIVSPSLGKEKYSIKGFCKEWYPKSKTEKNEGVLMLLEPKVK